MSSELTASVVIPTYNRPDHLRTCLQHLEEQTVRPERIIVVDSSSNDQSRTMVGKEFPKVDYRINPAGAGHTAGSRAIGVNEVTSDIVVFLDDDAFADEDWLARLLELYADPLVGGVGGRASNGVPGEEDEGRGQIGMFLPNGTLTGNFAADPGRVIKVDHFLGANMSFRRQALEGIGGIQDLYPGTCLREETDPALLVRNAGWHLLYNPEAVVRHVAGPYAKGRRFDTRYVYYGHRNHVVLLTRTMGRRSPEMKRYLAVAFRSVIEEPAVGIVRGIRRWRRPLRSARAVVGGVLRGSAIFAGTVSGIWASARLARREQGS